MRLIDADKMLAELLMINERSNIFAAPFARRTKRFIDRQPTIEERKHGHWEGGYKCSECGMHRAIDNGVYKLETGDNKYCLRCGAVMDKEAHRGEQNSILSSGTANCCRYQAHGKGV